MQSRPTSADHRLARISSWARLWLVWLAGALEFWPQARRGLDRIAHLVAIMVIIRADQARPKTATRRASRPSPLAAQTNNVWRATVRAAIGGRLRRVLMRGPIGQRLSAIFNVLQNMDAHVARMRRRLPRGFSRRAPILARPCAAAPLKAAFAQTLAPFADTS